MSPVPPVPPSCTVCNDTRTIRRDGGRRYECPGCQLGDVDIDLGHLAPPVVRPGTPLVPDDPVPGVAR